MVQPESFDFDFSSQKETNGKTNTTKQKVRVKFDTEDIVVFFGGLIALAMTVAMIAHWVPIDKLTVGLAGLSGVSAAAAKIIQAKRGKKKS